MVFRLVPENLGLAAIVGIAGGLIALVRGLGQMPAVLLAAWFGWTRHESVDPATG